MKLHLIILPMQMVFSFANSDDYCHFTQIFDEERIKSELMADSQGSVDDLLATIVDKVLGNEIDSMIIRD